MSKKRIRETVPVDEDFSEIAEKPKVTPGPCRYCGVDGAKAATHHDGKGRFACPNHIAYLRTKIPL